MSSAMGAALDRATAMPAPKVSRRIGRDEILLLTVASLLLIWLVLTVAAPLLALLSRAFETPAGGFAGLANFIRYVETPSLRQSLWNSLAMASVTTLICAPLAFAYAYALTRTAMPLRPLFGLIALLPLLSPTMLPALSLIYLFGNQGLFKDWLMGGSIYGFGGVVTAEVFACFPHALLIMLTALSATDARLYEAARSLGTSPSRRFFTITLPGARYGLISASLVIFTLAITDFGIPKIIGGQFNVLATDVYKQVIGQQNFPMGAVVGTVLLIPAVIAFLIDRQVTAKQAALVTARAVPLLPQRDWRMDGLALVFCCLVALFLIVLVGMAAWGSFLQYWPYNLTLTFANYDFARFDAAGWGSYWNALIVATLTAIFGTAIVFTGAYAQERLAGAGRLRAMVHFLAYLPVAVPGLVLGLGYVLFFNAPANPAGFIYGTFAILVVNTIAHFYTVSHLTAVTRLKQLDPEFERVSASLKVPLSVTFRRVTLPLCLPAVISIATYYFLNSLTTVSAIVFLYSASTKPASVAVLQMEEAGAIAAASAMAMVIVVTAVGVKGLQALVTRRLERRLAAWQVR